MGIGFRELLIILVIALVLFGAKRLRSVGSDLGAAVRGFKKAVNEGDDETTKQLNDLTRQGRRLQGASRTPPSRTASRTPDRAMFEVGFTEIVLILGDRAAGARAGSGCRSSRPTSGAGRARRAAMARQLKTQLEQEASTYDPLQRHRPQVLADDPHAAAACRRPTAPPRPRRPAHRRAGQRRDESKPA